MIRSRPRPGVNSKKSGGLLGKCRKRQRNREIERLRNMDRERKREEEKEGEDRENVKYMQERSADEREARQEREAI